jgi:hypothetical protein
VGDFPLRGAEFDKGIPLGKIHPGLKCPEGWVDGLSHFENPLWFMVPARLPKVPARWIFPTVPEV